MLTDFKMFLNEKLFHIFLQAIFTYALFYLFKIYLDLITIDLYNGSL